jgi:hypothetical protein
MLFESTNGYFREKSKMALVATGENFRKNGFLFCVIKGSNKSD